MTEAVWKTLVRDDGKQRIVIFQRTDGRFGFRQERLVRTPLGEKCWSFMRYSTICDAAETAEREAQAQLSWLRPR